MISLHPVVILGSHYWNQELLPRDEFAARMRATRALMKSHGWQGLLVFGDCAEPGMLAWLTNVCPRMRWTAALIGAGGEPTLVVPGAVRDFPMTAVMTPVTDIRSWGDVARILPEWVSALQASTGTKPAVAVHGFDRMAPSQRAAVARGLAAARALGIGRELDALAARTRPREAYLIRQGCTVLALAADTFRSVLATGAQPGPAALEAEKAARLAGAHDVRMLLGRDRGRSLEPFTSLDVPGDGASVVWIAVRFLGYWTEALLSSGAPAAAHAAVQAALGEAIGQARAGASRKALCAAAAARLEGLEPHAVLGRCAVRRIGLSLDPDLLGYGEEDSIQPGAVYSITAAASGTEGAAAVSALVRDGEVLWSAA